MNSYCVNNHWMWWPIAWVVFGLVFFLVCGRFWWGGRNGYYRHWGGYEPAEPLEILKKRYAKGEISKEEFDKMKQDIAKS